MKTTIFYRTSYLTTVADEKPTMYQLQYMSYTDEEGRNVHFRLMDRIQPRWARLAMALKFPQYTIAAMQRKADRVFHLLGEWLRGANQLNDARPLTWRTLITALWQANIQEEADILEKYLVTESAQETEPQSGQYCVL